MVGRRGRRGVHTRYTARKCSAPPNSLCPPSPRKPGLEKEESDAGQEHYGIESRSDRKLHVSAPNLSEMLKRLTTN